MLLYVILSVLSYAVQDFLGKIGIKYTTPTNLMFIRYLITALFLLILLIFYKEKRSEFLNSSKETIIIATLIAAYIQCA